MEPSYLVSLPTDLLRHMTGFLSMQDAYSLADTCLALRKTLKTSKQSPVQQHMVTHQVAWLCSQVLFLKGSGYQIHLRTATSHQPVTEDMAAVHEWMRAAYFQGGRSCVISIICSGANNTPPLVYVQQFLHCMRQAKMRHVMHPQINGEIRILILLPCSAVGQRWCANVSTKWIETRMHTLVLAHHLLNMDVRLRDHKSIVAKLLLVQSDNRKREVTNEYYMESMALLDNHLSRKGHVVISMRMKNNQLFPTHCTLSDQISAFIYAHCDRRKSFIEGSKADLVLHK